MMDYSAPENIHMNKYTTILVEDDDEFLLDQWNSLQFSGRRRGRYMSPARIFLAVMFTVLLVLGIWFFSSNKTVDQVAYNLRPGFNPDFWFPIPLIENEQALQGKLWSTRCPRNILNGGASHFEAEAKENKVRKVLNLIEEEEDKNTIKRAGAPLDPFYAKLGLEMERYSIADYSLPKDAESFKATVNKLYEDLKSGSNVVVHCGAGCGRTGMILFALYRKMGIEDPLEHLWKIRSDYIDTEDQQEWVKTIEF